MGQEIRKITSSAYMRWLSVGAGTLTTLCDAPFMAARDEEFTSTLESAD